MAASYGEAALTPRMIRAARLDAQVYEEVERDLNATSQALTVVLIVAVAAGIGQALVHLSGGRLGPAIVGFIGGVVLALLGWLVWSFLAYIVGTRLFNGVATYGELLRTIGFANSPGVLNILAFVPGLGPLIGFVVGIWILVATIVAMRQALDFDTTKAVLTAIVGFFAYLLLSALIGLIVAPFALLLSAI
jgi:hypothetical protein